MYLLDADVFTTFLFVYQDIAQHIVAEDKMSLVMRKPAF